MTRQRSQGNTRSTSPQDRVWDVPSILLAVTVMASPLLVGGVHAATAAGIAAVAIAGLWWSLLTRRPTSNQTGSFALSIPALGFAAMALFCLIQLIPIPSELYRLVQPTGMAAVDANWTVAFDEAMPRRWHLLSLDPHQTTTHALRWTALAAAAALASQVITDRRGRRRWLGVIAIIGAVVAIAGTIQQISGTEKILGVYDAQLHPRSMSPFVSTNHAASFYALIALVSIAYGIDHLRRSPLKASLGAVGATGGILLCAAHGSDGALLALAIGVGLLGISVVTWITGRTHFSRHRLRVGAIAALALFFVVTVAATFVPDKWTVAQQEESIFTGTSFELRVHLAGAVFDASTDFAVAGSGAGSIERALPPYLDWFEIGTNTVPTIEAEPIEWVMTMGPAVAIAALLLFLFVVARTAPHIWRLRARRGPATASVLAVFLGVIALFHFPFTALGISLVAVVAIEACLDRKRDRLHLVGSKKAALIFALALSAVVGGMLAARATVLTPGVETNHEVEDPQELRRALHLYPTDGVLWSAMSLHQRSLGEHERALDYARRAFELRPHAQQQFLLAGSLANADHRQEAAQVYQSLFDRERNGSGSAARWARQRLAYDLPTAELRATAFADAAPSRWRRFVRDIGGDETDPTAPIDFALALVEIRPDRPEAHLLLIDLFDRADQRELAELYARMLIARDLVAPDGQRPAGLLFLLELLHDEERSDEARNIAHRAFDVGRSSPELGRLVLRLLPDDPTLLDSDHERLFTAALDVGCTAPYERGHRQLCWQSLAFFAEYEGDIDRAARYLRRIEHLHDDPRPLATLFARHRRCRDLAALQRQYEGARYARFIDRRVAECAHPFD